MGKYVVQEGKMIKVDEASDKNRKGDDFVNVISSRSGRKIKIILKDAYIHMSDTMKMNLLANSMAESALEYDDTQIMKELILTFK
jgi:hypothetical protein